MWLAAPPSPAKTHGPANANTNAPLFRLGKRNPVSSSAALTHRPTTPPHHHHPLGLLCCLLLITDKESRSVDGFPADSGKSPATVNGTKVTGTTGRDALAVAGARARAHSPPPPQDPTNLETKRCEIFERNTRKSTEAPVLSQQ